MSESLRVLPLYNRARDFAAQAHHGQVRRYTQEPYFNHLEEVANLVREVAPQDQAMIAAAYLHDTLEDTDTSYADLFHHFDRYTANLVWWLTDVSQPFHGNRAYRKSLDRHHISLAPSQAQTIKLADLVSNTHSIVEHDPNFAKVYLAEKLKLLDVLTKGDRYLHSFATHLAHTGLQKALASVTHRPTD